MDGSIRFDALQELKVKHPKALVDLNWENVYLRPDLQLRAVVLKANDNFNYYKPYSSTTDDALAFADAAYNGGIGGLDRERRACKIASNCDHTKWFGNVEKYCMKSKAVLYGNRSACDINRHHVVDVLNVRSSKYIPFFIESKPSKIEKPIKKIEEPIKKVEEPIKKVEEPKSGTIIEPNKPELLWHQILVKKLADVLAKIL